MVQPLQIRPDMRQVLPLLFVVGCTAMPPIGDDDAETEPTEQPAPPPPAQEEPPPPTEPATLADVTCDGAPNAGATRAWRHYASRLVIEAGAPRHRGVDLIAADTDATQTIAGKIAYGTVDADLEDEDVDLFACLDHAWQPIGTARTDVDGRFALALAGDARLPAGMRDMFASVAGDRTGVAFLAFVAPASRRVIVSDVDGTLTASENAYPYSLASGGDVAPQPGAPHALATAAANAITVVYISARGDYFTQDTRAWLAANGFPRGPVHLPRTIVTVPGEDTIEFKSNALALVAPFDFIAGVGNRATDVAAYTNAGLPASRIFVKLGEFADELAADLDAGNATGFWAYDDLPVATW